MRRSIYEEDEDVTEIDLSSMIDCIFILLIFFIVTTVFVEEQGVQVAKPDATATLDLEESESLTVEVTAENKILFEDQEIALAELAGKVKARAGDGETPIVIQAHEKSDHGTFVSVWDSVKRSSPGSLSFHTVH